MVGIYSKINKPESLFRIWGTGGKASDYRRVGPPQQD